MCHRANPLCSQYIVSGVGQYAVLTPSIEMYMDSYNQWGGWASGRGPQSYKWQSSNGYNVGVNGDYPNNTGYQNSNSLSNGPNSIYYTSGNGNYWFLASPSCSGNRNIFISSGYNASIYSLEGSKYGICPIVSLGQPDIYLKPSETILGMGYSENKTITFENPFDMNITAVSNDTTVATVTKNSNTQITITSKSKNGSVTVTVTGTNTTSGRTISVNIDLGVYNGTGAIPIKYAKAVINSSNIVSYQGMQVDYSPTGGGVWRIFYCDRYNKYGDGSNALYIKRDYDSNTNINGASRVTFYSSQSDNMVVLAMKADMRKFNSQWKNGDSNINENNEFLASYLCYHGATECNQYLVNGIGKYAILSPSVEMYIDAWKQFSQSNNISYKWSASGSDVKTPLSGGSVLWGSTKVNGYTFLPSGTIYPEYSSRSSLTDDQNSSMFTSGSWWLASPSSYGADYMTYVNRS
ncbi:MAG: hypothetical protein IJ809_01455 [Clostridia bacterium]|nr:hypothetical protein [Clostridia bacterium]